MRNPLTATKMDRDKKLEQNWGSYHTQELEKKRQIWKENEEKVVKVWRGKEGSTVGLEIDEMRIGLDLCVPDSVLFSESRQD